MKKRTTAILLAIFLGWSGAHKFYLRDAGTGFFYLLLTIFSASLRLPIGTILGWIDAFRYITMSDEYFDKKFNSGTQSTRTRGRRNSRDYVEGRRENRYQRRDTRRDTRRTTKQAPPINKGNSRSYERKRKNVIKDNPFKASGIKRLDNFELDLAQVDLKRAIELSPDDKDIHIAMARLYSMEENENKSMYHISRAVKLGYTDFNHIRTVDGFAFLRLTEKYEEFEESGFRAVRVATPKEEEQTTSSKPADQPVTPPENDLLQDDLLLSQLNKLKELRNKGIISEKEFVEERVKLTQR